MDSTTIKNFGENFDNFQTNGYRWMRGKAEIGRLSNLSIARLRTKSSALPSTPHVHCTHCYCRHQGSVSPTSAAHLALVHKTRLAPLESSFSYKSSLSGRENDQLAASGMGDTSSMERPKFLSQRVHRAATATVPQLLLFTASPADRHMSERTTKPAQLPP